MKCKIDYIHVNQIIITYLNFIFILLFFHDLKAVVDYIKLSVQKAKLSDKYYL